MHREQSELLEVPASRAAGLRAVRDRLLGARSVVLTTHVNADGDGCGSQAAVAAWLESRGIRATIVNPTPFPALFRFLLHRADLAADLETAEAEAALREADLFLVLDTSEPNRVAPLLDHLDPARTLVVDHHPAGPSVVGSQGVQDPTAAATGELAFDLIALAEDRWPADCALGVYVALVSDTGSFRFSNTTPRAHAVAAAMLLRGVDPEAVFQRLYATFPRRRFSLLGEALQRLECEPELGLSWIVVPASVSREVQAEGEDFEGLVDHARSIEGTRVAVLFRELPEGEVKVSWRANGDTDVNRVARVFGGGGHVKASGARVPGPLDQAVRRVLERTRQALGE
jgi:phosphoesterase RecJ-like protein